MTYNVYIKTQSKSYNILNINKNDLEIVINAYEEGKESFFIAGTKYWITKLFEIKIFTFPHPEKFQDFIDLAEYKGLYKKGVYGDPYLPPNVLKVGGDDVTRDFIKGGFGDKLAEKPNVNQSLEMEIFISHSSSDVEIAKALINILRKAFNIPAESIRCTSVPGHKLKAGANTDEQLKKEIFSSKAFIGLITRESISSTYVLFELGARWGVDLPLIPLICDAVGTSLLHGPIKNINALSALDSSDMLQFLTDLGDILESKPENPSSYIEDIEKLKVLIAGNKKESEEESSKESKDFDDAYEIINKQSEIEWPDNYEMRVDYIKAQRAAVDELKKGKPDDLTEIEFSRIRERAKNEWPLNFEMRLDEEKRQIESLRELKEI